MRNDLPHTYTNNRGAKNLGKTNSDQEKMGTLLDYQGRTVRIRRCQLF